MVSAFQQSCCDPSSLCHSWKGPGNKWWLGWKPSFSRQRAEQEVLHNIYVGWPPGAHQPGCTFFPFLPVSFHWMTLNRMLKSPWLLSVLHCSVSVQLDAGVILSYVFMRLTMTIDMTWISSYRLLYKSVQSTLTPETGGVNVCQTMRGGQHKVFVHQVLFRMRHICMEEAVILFEMIN